MITSLGFHTFTIFIVLSWDEINELINHFKEYRKIDKDLLQPFPRGKLNRFTTSDGAVREAYSWYKVAYGKGAKRGVCWNLRFYNCFNFFMVEARINPKLLVGEIDYLSASNESYFGRTVEKYNSLAKKISPHLRCFEAYYLKRVDPCLNLDMVELGYPCTKEQMIALLKQGNIPNGFEEPYNPASHRRGYKESFYLKPKSKSGKEKWFTINCYDKYCELLKNSPDNPCLDDSKNLVRFEVQCKRNKVREFRKIAEVKLSHNRPTDLFGTPSHISELEITKELLSDYMMKNIIYKEFHRTIMGGDYYSLRAARKKIDSLETCSSRKALMTWAIEFVNDCHGIYNAKQRLKKENEEALKSGDNEAARIALSKSSRLYYALEYLVNSDINPVTIPNWWNIPYMSGLWKAYQAFSELHNLK